MTLIAHLRRLSVSWICCLLDNCLFKYYSFCGECDETADVPSDVLLREVSAHSSDGVAGSSL